MLPLPVQLTPPNLPHQEPVTASLLRHCFSQTRDRQTPWTNHHTKEGGWLWLNHHPCFSTSKMPKKSTGIYLILFCPKFPQRYFAKISYKIFRQNVMNDTLPKYPERFFAKVFRKIFCQNIPPDILPEYPAKYFARISRKIFWQHFANISHKISCQNSHKDLGNNLHHPLLVHIKSLPGAMVSPGPSPSERVPAMIKIAFKAMHSCSLLSGIWKTC